MQLLERTQECEPKYYLWPYKRRNTWGSITKNYRCVDLTMMHICTKFERNPSRNVACRAHTRFPPKYDLWPYKRRNTGGSIIKNYRRVDITKIHLYTKFERDPSRNAAVRAHTRMWRGGVTLLNPKYPPYMGQKFECCTIRQWAQWSISLQKCDSVTYILGGCENGVIWKHLGSGTTYRFSHAQILRIN